MCMYLEKDWKRKTRKYKKFLFFFNRKKPIKAYKLLRRHPTGKITSLLYSEFIWNEGENISDRASNRLSHIELCSSQVNLGFHFWLDKSQALAMHCGLSRIMNGFISGYGMVIYEFEIDPKDVIAVGSGYGYEIVATKCRLIGPAKA